MALARGIQVVGPLDFGPAEPDRRQDETPSGRTFVGPNDMSPRESAFTVRREPLPYEQEFLCRAAVARGIMTAREALTFFGAEDAAVPREPRWQSVPTAPDLPTEITIHGPTIRLPVGVAGGLSELAIADMRPGERRRVDLPGGRVVYVTREAAWNENPNVALDADDQPFNLPLHNYPADSPGDVIVVTHASVRIPFVDPAGGVGQVVVADLRPGELRRVAVPHSTQVLYVRRSPDSGYIDDGANAAPLWRWRADDGVVAAQDLGTYDLTPQTLDVDDWPTPSSYVYGGVNVGDRVRLRQGAGWTDRARIQKHLSPHLVYTVESLRVENARRPTVRLVEVPGVTFDSAYFEPVDR